MRAVPRLARVAVLVLLLLSVAVGGVQAGANARLRGEYQFTQSRQCINASAGFNADLSLVLPVPAGGFINKTAHVDRGTVQYNGDGTGVASVHSTRLRINQGLAGNLTVTAPVSESDVSCTLTYTVNADGSVDHQATCNFTVVAGDGVGNTGAVTGIQTRRQIVHGNTMLLHMPANTPTVETVLDTTAGPPVVDYYRVCMRSGISSK